MKKLTALGCTAVAAVLLFTGCASMFERDYLVISAHLDEQAQMTEEDYIAVENYGELREAILYLIESSAEEGVLRAYTYSGDFKKELPIAIYTVLNGEPLGVYSVEYIPYEAPVSFPGYDEVRLSVTYSRTRQERDTIRQVSGNDTFTKLVGDTLRDFQPGLAAQTAYYNEGSYDVKSVVEKYYYAHPETALVLPQYSVKLYPEIGLKRIIEIKFTYSNIRTELQKLSADIMDKADELAEEAGSEQDALKRLARLYDLLTLRTDPDLDAVQEALRQGELYEKDYSSTAYGALIKQSADSEGYALAFKALCDRSDISCQVVSGRFNGISHYWNIVELDKQYYHVDVIAGDMDAGAPYGVFMLGDDAMPSGYSWSDVDYPACEETGPDYYHITGTSPPAVETPTAEDNEAGQQEE